MTGPHVVWVAGAGAEGEEVSAEGGGVGGAQLELAHTLVADRRVGVDHVVGGGEGDGFDIAGVHLLAGLRTNAKRRPMPSGISEGAHAADIELDMADAMRRDCVQYFCERGGFECAGEDTDLHSDAS